MSRCNFRSIRRSDTYEYSIESSRSRQQLTLFGFNFPTVGCCVTFIQSFILPKFPKHDVDNDMIIHDINIEICQYELQLYINSLHSEALL
jgi:hypothetical protein